MIRSVRLAVMETHVLERIYTFSRDHRSECSGYTHAVQVKCIPSRDINSFSIPKNKKMCSTMKHVEKRKYFLTIFSGD
jgi:hypothetical protein